MVTAVSARVAAVSGWLVCRSLAPYAWNVKACQPSAVCWTPYKHCSAFEHREPMLHNQSSKSHCSGKGWFSIGFFTTLTSKPHCSWSSWSCEIAMRGPSRHASNSVAPCMLTCLHRPKSSYWSADLRNSNNCVPTLRFRWQRPNQRIKFSHESQDRNIP